MKKKTLRKLTLSAVTLGVATLSLTTTTYAWFTTNSTAEANGVSGTVSSSGVTMLVKSPTGWDTSKLNSPSYDGSYKWDTNTMINVENNKEAPTFKQSTTLINESGNGDTRTTLSPVSINSTTVNSNKFDTISFTKLNNTTNAEDTLTNAKDYLHYQVVLSISGLEKDKTYNVSMILPEINDTAVNQYLLVDAGSEATAGKTISVSLADALSLGIKNTVLSGEQTKDTYNIKNGGTISSLITDNGGFYHAKAETDKVTIAGEEKEGNALTYYKNVYNLTSFEKPNEYKDKYTVSVDESANCYFANWNTNAKTIYQIKGTEDSNSFVCVTDLYFFIDGWDNQCFNAIGGQSLFVNTGEQSITFACTEAQ